MKSIEYKPAHSGYSRPCIKTYFTESYTRELDVMCYGQHYEILDKETRTVLGRIKSQSTETKPNTPMSLTTPEGHPIAYPYPQRMPSAPEMFEASKEFKKAAETIEEYAKRQVQSTESANAEIFAGAVSALNTPRRPTVEEMGERIAKKCEEISQMLRGKNASYASSVFLPSNILSPLSAIDAIRVRIDDKLTRMKNGHAYKCENDILDVVGYFICELVIRDMATQSNPAKND